MPLWAIKLCGIVAVVTCLFVAGWNVGADNVQKKWDDEHDALALAAANQKAEQTEVTNDQTTKYVERVEYVRGKTKIIIKEVPVYVTKAADADCVVNTGFVMLHNSAATNEIPNSPAAVNETPSGIALSAVAATVVENYGICHEYVETIKGWQNWATAEAAVK